MMAPKTRSSKEASKSGHKDATADAPISPVEELQHECAALKQEQAALEASRMYLQLERDKVIQFWDITKRELAESRAELRHLDRQAEEAEQQHQVETKVYRQKIKHLLYEHQNHIAVLKADEEAAVAQTREEGAAREAALAEDKMAFRQQLWAQEASAQEALDIARIDAAKMVSKLRLEDNTAAKELAGSMGRRMAEAIEGAGLQRRQEAAQAAKLRDAAIQELKDAHAAALAEFKAYFNETTSKNLDSIAALKREVEDLMQREEQAQAAAQDAAKKSSDMAEALAQAQKVAAALWTATEAQGHTAASLDAARKQVAVAEQRIRHLSWENEVLVQKLESLGHPARMLCPPAEIVQQPATA